MGLFKASNDSVQMRDQIVSEHYDAFLCGHTPKDHFRCPKGATNDVPAWTIVYRCTLQAI
jgi:hypothetical protein